ncbi:MAG: biotin/lipoyl-containing protein [Chloroflexota bacterium]|nr:biotin/lipoyl-containing protein [Chloroflexota bacterium]
MTKYLTTINGKQFEIDIDKEGKVTVNGEPRDIDFLPLSPSLYNLLIQTKSHDMVVDERDGEYQVMMGGRLYTGEVLDERAQLLASTRTGAGASSGEISIKSPMPGLVVAVPVAEGQEIKGGQTVIILESMKMQNELKAPRDGVVSRINATAGQSVEQGKLLITIV